MNKLRIIIALLLVLTLSCVQEETSKLTQLTLSLGIEEFNTINPESLIFCIDDSGQYDLNYLKDNLREVPAKVMEKIDDFIKSPKWYLIEGSFKMNEILFTNEHSDQTTGLISISLPIEVSKNEILIYFNLLCGNDCGGGSYYLFEKKGQNWTLKDSYPLWVGFRG
jgi:hypothetical protein